MKIKADSAPITAHDLLKTFAVVIMIIDHIGYYFFPEQLWWRSIGRIGFPIWFYLVGHATSRDFSPKLLGGALLLVVMNVVVGMPVFSLNALVTIMILRIIIDPVMKVVVASEKTLWMFLLIGTLLIIPTDLVTEYGTQALMFAMLGYMVRHRETLPFSKDTLQLFMAVIAVIFLGYQHLNFIFDPAQLIFMVLGTLGVCMVLVNFQAKIYPALTDKTPKILADFFRFCGHRTLEIYVVHLVLFKIMALSMGLENYQLFNMRLWP